MDRMGHAQIQTTQKYLHTLPDTDQKNLDALTRMIGRSVLSGELMKLVAANRMRRLRRRAEATQRSRGGRSREPNESGQS